MTTVRNNGNKQNEEAFVIREYSGLAPTYDSRWASYITATLRETLKRLDINPSDRLLDIGCGTGSLLQAISQKHPSVNLIGLDISREMLKVACNKQIGKCNFITGQVQFLPFHSNSFDVVVSCNAFHYWRSPESCLKEILRVLKPKGRIIITDWCDDYVACKFCDLFLRLFNLAHFKTYGKDACELLLQKAGFVTVQVDRYKINWLWGMMTASAQTPVAC